MSAPVYFLAGVTIAQLFPDEQVDRGVLARYGLAELWRDVAPGRNVDWYAGELTQATGPGKQPGVLVSALPIESRQPPRSLEYRPSDATWQWQELAEGRTWIGIDQTQPVQPEDVARRKQQQGYWVKLEDGQRWLVPVIRRPEWTDTTVASETESATPQRQFGPGEPMLDLLHKVDWRNRRVEKSVRPCDQRIWDWSARFYNLIYRETELTQADVPDEFEQCEFCAMLLAMNYRLTGDELNVLGLLGDSSRSDMIACALALPWYHENKATWMQKKS